MYILMHKISYRGNVSIGFTDIEIATSLVLLAMTMQ